ncbi:MAG: DUF4115 domain-containing protein [Gallionella sp.]|nr:DUF4115 domain-containing protein [Gallionella sp.]
MEQEINSEAAVVSDDVQKLSVGSSLRAARENLGLSIEDVVAKIKLAPRQIIALEADDFQALPETAFLRGFVRSYARLLQLDEQPLLDALPGTVSVAAELPRVDASYPSERSKYRQNLNLLIAALFVAFLIAGFAIWQTSSPQETAVPEEAALVSIALPDPAQIQDASGVAESSASAVASVSAVVSAPVVVQAAAVSAVLSPAALPPAAVAGQSAPAALRLVFDKEAWAEIKDKTGKTLLKQLNQPGSELSVDGSAPFAMVIGHATSVHLYYRGRPVDMTPYVSASSDVARLTLE